VTVYVGEIAADGVPRCAACRRDQRPLWRRWGRLYCASCVTKRLCADGSLEPIAFYAKPTKPAR
jgi:hypothetical protein